MNYLKASQGVEPKDDNEILFRQMRKKKILQNNSPNIKTENNVGKTIYSDGNPFLKQRKKRSSLKVTNTKKDEAEITQGSGLDYCGSTMPTNQNIASAARMVTNNWPWMAQLSVQKKDGQDLICGGALISEIHVLTAAHCFDSLR